jgi:hypothetical protein
VNLSYQPLLLPAEPTALHQKRSCLNPESRFD